MPLLGSWDNTTRRDLAVEEARTLEVNATVVSGRSRSPPCRPVELTWP